MPNRVASSASISSRRALRFGVGRQRGRGRDLVRHVADLFERSHGSIREDASRRGVDCDFQWHVVSPNSSVEATGMMACPVVRSALKPDGLRRTATRDGPVASQVGEHCQ
jgi:hypothetical protein